MSTRQMKSSEAQLTRIGVTSGKGDAAQVSSSLAELGVSGRSGPLAMLNSLIEMTRHVGRLDRLVLYRVDRGGRWIADLASWPATMMLTTKGRRAVMVDLAVAVGLATRDEIELQALIRSNVGRAKRKLVGLISSAETGSSLGSGLDSSTGARIHLVKVSESYTVLSQGPVGALVLATRIQDPWEAVEVYLAECMAARVAPIGSLPGPTEIET